MLTCIENGDRKLYGKYIGLYLTNLKYYNEDVAFDKAYSKAMDDLVWHEKCITNISLEGIIEREYI